MTSDVDRFTFLLKQKPICTQTPLKSYLGAEEHRELRAKYKLELGFDLMDDRCPVSFNCKSINSGCIGRPFPFDDRIREALESINVDISIGEYKGIKVYLAKAIVLCDNCPFKASCDSSCATQDSYVRRSVRPESNPPESSLVPYDDFERGIYKALDEAYTQHCEYGDWINETLPMDCLTPRQREVMEMTLYEGLDQVTIAYRLGIGQDVVSRHKSSAISKMTEFGKARKVLSGLRLIPRSVLDYYVNNLTQQEIADKLGRDRSTVAKNIQKWYKDNCS